MVTTVLLRLRQAVLLMLLTVSLNATAFAHRMPSPDDGALAFALANGMTLADLCASDLDGDGVRDGHCPACQITATPGLPATAPALIDLELAFVLQVVAPRESRALARILDPARSPQGPPAA
jgi:hypothetical protein